MAVFNAPLDLDDYVFHAVKAAWDMKMGAIALEEKAQKQFHTSVEFGIGIHCGNAVVGNIGASAHSLRISHSSVLILLFKA